MKMTHIVAALLALGLATISTAETLTAKGETDISIKANGDLINARRIAREQAERDAVGGLLRTRLSADLNDPKVKNALADLRKQLTDSLKTSFNAEGDMLTARTTLQVDAAQFFDLAKSLGVTSRAASATAKVLFLIDEYYGVATKLDPARPLVTEIDYVHDKSSFSDRTASASGAKSASAASASAAKASFASAESEKSAFAASASAAASGRDKQAYAASDKQSLAGAERRAVGFNDGAGGSVGAAGSSQISAARDTQQTGARDAQFSASQKSAVAGSSASQSALAASSESASAARSASASNFATRQNDVQKQNDIVSYKVRQVFPGIDNAKPADDSSAMIGQKLQQVVKEFGLLYTDEKDFRVEGGRKLTISDITRLQKYDAYLKRAAQGNYKAKYLVYGTAIMQAEGQTTSGQAQCSGQLALTSSDVDTGEGFVSGTINKRALGSSDQDCRSNLAQALAHSLADTVGTSAQRDIQQAASQGRTYSVALYSANSVPAKLRRLFSAKVKALDGVVEVNDDGNASEGMRRWTVIAKGNFAEQIEDLIDEVKEVDNSSYKTARFEKRGNRMIFCVEGKCPQEY
jgi:hypothetical protein